MKELLRTNDPVRLSFLTAYLADEGIEVLVFDQHSSIADGSIAAIPRRMMVADGDHERATSLLRQAGELE